MINTYSKNIPYIAGTLASIALLASGVFAAAPYVGFLSSVAALGLTFPVIASLFVFSAVVAVFSYRAIEKNITLKEVRNENEVVSEKIEDGGTISPILPIIPAAGIALGVAGNLSQDGQDANVSNAASHSNDVNNETCSVNSHDQGFENDRMNGTEAYGLTKNNNAESLVDPRKLDEYSQNLVNGYKKFSDDEYDICKIQGHYDNITCKRDNYYHGIKTHVTSLSLTSLGLFSSIAAPHYAKLG